VNFLGVLEVPVLGLPFHIPWMDYPGDAYPGHPMEVDFPSLHKRFLDTVGDGSCLCYAALVDIPWSELQLAVANYYCHLLVALSFDGLYTCCSADDCAAGDSHRSCFHTQGC